MITTSQVDLSETISPICLTQKGSPFTDKLATVAGWGSINYGDSPPESLREVEVFKNLTIIHLLSSNFRILLHFDFYLTR